MGALATVAASIAVTGSSSASFTASTSSPSSVSAAADWTPPKVTVTAPATAVKGTTTISALATDDVSGIGTVTIELETDGVWTNLCAPIRRAPYSCDWSTSSVADGSYELRATALDNAGNTTTSATVSTTVANTLTIALPRLDGFLRGPFSTTTTLRNVGSLKPSSVRVEYLAGDTWTHFCTSTSTPYTCSGDVGSSANGTYALRSIAVIGTTEFTSPSVSRNLDNSGPTVTLNDPGATLKGATPFTIAATDAGSGVANVLVEVKSGISWTTLCTATSTPYACSGDLSSLAEGAYDFRAVATDRLGNTGTSDIVTREVKNVSITLTAPSSTYLKGTAVTLAADVQPTGNGSVTFQRSIAGANTWVNIVCKTPLTANKCSWDTTSTPDGTYDLRAVLMMPNSTTIRAASPVLTNRIVDNTPGKGVDIQTTNGGTAGRIDKGDTIIYTFSEQMDLSSIYSGWSATATSATTPGKVQLSNEPWWVNEELTLASPGSANLGLVALNDDFFLLGTTLDVTMSAATVTENGVARTVVTIRIDETSASWAGITKAATMGWTPSSSIRDLAGNSISTAKVNESGTKDVDF